MTKKQVVASAIEEQLNADVPTFEEVEREREWLRQEMEYYDRIEADRFYRCHDDERNESCSEAYWDNVHQMGIESGLS